MCTSTGMVDVPLLNSHAAGVYICTVYIPRLSPFIQCYKTCVWRTSLALTAVSHNATTTKHGPQTELERRTCSTFMFHNWKRRRNQFCDHVVRRSMASRGYCVAGPVCLLLKTHSAAAHCKQQKKVRSPLPAKSTNCAVSSKLGDFPAVIISKITLIINIRVFAFRLPYPSFSFFKTSACMHSRYLRVGGWT